VAVLSFITCFLVLVGIVRLRDGLRDRYPVEDYLDLFDLAAHQIHQGLQASSTKDQSQINKIIIGMASAQVGVGGGRGSSISGVLAHALSRAQLSLTSRALADSCRRPRTLSSPHGCHFFSYIKCPHHCTITMKQKCLASALIPCRLKDG
jgi:hypothetical protein